ncbi:AraC family transcriptional regulator [sulfur-oxidizing endosymbiont of Gigantopelta aegis]|uniref:AraC family transcriptional regulator n=1 Tax=sulfur-oxidizing endosymbiont of Gigantopelta aegis TaxID=2794934 RepID=UPI0018DE65B9|nr:helix-turn-helix domain-containing protein [sulfur-oxidizing endosymbiont of Gigantopelta aegis]
MNQISIAMAGFSIIASILLLFQKRTETQTAKKLAQILLGVLIIIQLLQALYIGDYLSFDRINALVYLLSLGLVGPLFYLYSQHIIQSSEEWTLKEYRHFLPVIAGSLVVLLFPEHFNQLYALMFLLGGIYMSRLAWSLYLLRAKRSLFKMEFLFTALFLSWTIAVVLLGLFNSQIIDILLPVQTIMLAFLLAAAIHIQLNYPHLLSSLEEIASRQYQTSTLVSVDCDTKKSQLEKLMTIDQAYQDSELSLSSCAEMLSLKPHQLSELINIHLAMNFSAYLRQQRIKASEVLLKNEPAVSVLAIGLSVGFSSQSAFYSAFKEIHHIAPGQYRRQIHTK